MRERLFLLAAGLAIWLLIVLYVPGCMIIFEE